MIVLKLLGGGCICEICQQSIAVTAWLCTRSSEGDVMHTVTKKELIDRIADQTKHKRVVVKDVVQRFLNEIISELGSGNRLEFRDFGVFETKARAPRIAQNPKTLQRVQVPPKRTVKFKVGRLMKVRLTEGMEQQTPTAEPKGGSSAA